MPRCTHYQGICDHLVCSKERRRSKQAEFFRLAAETAKGPDPELQRLDLLGSEQGRLEAAEKARRGQS